MLTASDELVTVATTTMVDVGSAPFAVGVAAFAAGPVCCRRIVGTIDIVYRHGVRGVVERRRTTLVDAAGEKKGC